MKRLILALAAIVAVVAGATVAGGADRPAKAKPSPTVHLGATKIGRVVVDARGRTLYLFEKDRHGRSACYRACARNWPPALVKGAPTAGPGVVASRLGTTRRHDGSRQLTLGGHPLYRFVLDTGPGQAKGQDVKAFGAEWYAVHGSGRKVHG
jgi:predicted lipoprotein with Yx(FWY)xxD motif